MNNDKQGIDLIIDRVEAIRVRLGSLRAEIVDEGTGQASIASSVLASVEHWMQLCVEAKTEAVKIARVLGGGGLTPDELRIGQRGHRGCGWCAEHNLPMYECLCNGKRTAPPEVR